jgi:hypothetical protein
MAADGKFVGLWTVSTYNGSALVAKNVEGQYFNSDGTPLGSVFTLDLSGGNDYGTYGDFTVDGAALNASGNLAITWHSGIDWSIYAGLFSGPN